MKNCQEQQKKQLKFNKKLLRILNGKNIITKVILSCLIFCFIINCILFLSVNILKAQDLSGPVTGGLGDFIKVGDKWVLKDSMLGRAARAVDWTKDHIMWLDKWIGEQYAARYWSAALKYFLNTLASDTATYLASGDEGQKPMFITEGWGEYLVNTADTAAGYFIESVGQELWDTKFNLCEPDFNVKVKIGLGLQRWHKPKAPECTFSEMTDNWEEALQSDDFLNDFQDMFNPWSNDLGTALTLQTQLGAEVDKKVNEVKFAQIADRWKDVTDSISGKTKTPKDLVQKSGEKVMDDSTAREKVYTGDYLADSISIFINTLIGTLVEEWLKKGLVTEFDEYQPWGYDDLADYEGQASSGGIAGAEDRFRELIEPDFGVRGDYEILGELISCPDPTKAGPTNCVITENFRQAIINRMTVGQAMDQGYLNAAGIFGFTADGLEPDYYDEGYPYRSMIILRKFRIIPVGWELAAQYIKDFSNETLNLGDLVACYDPSDDWDGYSEGWCQGLVDPNWVLKAPLNYCKREGPGPEIISEMVIGEGYDSELSISRDSNYCADEQSCIKENDDGSCQLYGYCTEERRKWQFNGTNCDPKYNTCQTFRSRTGNTASYLENTLDYGVCSADNVGCQPYCTDYDFTADSWNCTLASVGDKLYADKDIEECDEDDEGCHEFIRTKAGLGANLLTNSSFEDDFDEWPEAIPAGAIINTDSYDGLQSLQLSGILTKPVDVASTTHLVAGEIFSLSFYAKNCATGDDFGIEADAVSLNDGSNWQYYQTTYVYPTDAEGNQVNFTVNTASCIIDAIKLERGITATAYSDYRGNGLIYQKLAPDYLGCAGAATDPDECDNFIRKCDQGEVGCELYTSVTDNMSIPAKVIAQDYCAAECVGYDTYIQQETAFDSLRDNYFIPSTARTCGAETAGCDEFTNLDEVAKGGEGIEYYSYLRQCVKPSDPGADCAEFYTWEGSDETGFQLRLHSLEEDLIGADGVWNDPDVTSDDTTECDAAIYGLPATDPGYNSDCREFYNDSGEISYHLYTRTISCNEDCHPYRRTENNIDPNLDNSSCVAGGDGSSQYIGTVNDQFEWDATYEVCYFCKNRGEWDDGHQACIYMAVPGEGVGCSASQNGCREYTGNVGNNMRIILNNDFEGSLQGWTGIDGAAAELSSTALMAGGESLRVYNADFTASTTVGSLAQKNKSYVLSFLAQSAGATQISAIQLVNGAGDEADFIADPLIMGGWQLYKVNLAALNHDVSDSESLVIEANGDFYIDDIRLTEITDRWYLIKNSWVTPDSCYEDILGNYVGPIYNLGCDEYRDRDNNTHFLHSFSQLCQDSAVGCEIMIDTHNYSDYNSQTFNAGDLSEIVVPEDSFIYAVYDRDKKCNARDKGCQRLGEPYQYESNVLYSDIYLKNNPDKYYDILCLDNEVGCEEWITAEGTDYFKDPDDQLCEWRQAAGIAAGSWAWQKKKVKRCDDDGNGAIDAVETAVCLTDSNCAGNISCILDNNDYVCPVSSYKTIGKGGAGNVVEQPTYGADGYWIGLCPTIHAGCTEYIDPVSRFSANMLYNADFSQDVDSDGLADGWDAIVNGAQNIVLETRTLYILAVEDNNTATVGATNNDFYRLDSNNQLIGPFNAISVASVAGSRASKRFYTNVEVAGDVTVNDASASNGSKIELKKAIVDYQLKQDLDKTSCNGIVNFEDGCVLFNERNQNGISLAGLEWDADLTVNDGAGITPDAGVDSEQDANILLKVTPDRVCNKWLACRSYIKDENDNNVCFDIGLCDSVDDNGNCNSFVITNQVNQTYPNLISPELAGNMSGYAKAGYINNSLNADYYPLGAMKQVGEVAQVPNGGFEWAGSNGYPIGWVWTGGIWDENVFSVIDNPYQAQEEGIGYAPEGRNFLKLGSIHSATSEFIDVEPNIDYILTAHINTINLSEGIAAIKVKQFNNAGNFLASNDSIVMLNGGNKWTYKLGSFTTVANASRIKIILHSHNTVSAVGNFYFDDVKIRPALDSRSGEGIMITVIQGSSVYHIPAAFSTAETATEFYNYTAASFNNPAFYSFIEADRSELFVHYSLSTGRISAVFFHDYPNDLLDPDLDPDGGSLTFDFTSITPGNQVAVKDDPGEDPGIITGSPIVSGQSWAWDWGDCCTDGGMVEMPPGNWSITIDPHFISGIDKWAYIYSGGEITLDTNQPVTLIYEEDLKGYTPQTCRLYPQDDSLSCDYYEDSGIKQKGWLGYCLEYDRYPGSSDACLLWWPVDKVKGEGIEEGAGYADRFPLYYSTDIDYQAFSQSVTHSVSVLLSECSGKCSLNTSAPFYPDEFITADYQLQFLNENYIDQIVGLTANYAGQVCEPLTQANGWCSSCMWKCGSGRCGRFNSAFFNDDGSLREIRAAHCDTSDSHGTVISVTVTVYFKAPYASKISQVVTPVGQNKYWSGRVYQGSDYEFSCNSGLYGVNTTCDYLSDYPPFGSAIPPYPVNNPYEWDSKDTAGIQPLYYELPEGDPGQARMGQSHTVDSIKRLFAQSYGTWQWDGSHYIPVSGQDWTVPTNLCNGTGLAPRPDYPNDFCGIKPIISNIKANSQSGNIVLNNNQFINLTLNSKADSQQLPLVMYAINWGDNEWTVVTGVEMRDRPNTDNPHSLYHLYSYWDLKAKHSVDKDDLATAENENAIYCGNASNSALNYNNSDSGYDCPASGACCIVKPSAKVKDNWGWCNNGVGGNPCPAGGYDLFGGWIVVKEK